MIFALMFWHSEIPRPVKMWAGNNAMPERSKRAAFGRGPGASSFQVAALVSSILTAVFAVGPAISFSACEAYRAQS